MILFLKKIKYWSKNFLKFEKNYFVVGGNYKALKYFFSQGNILRHIEDRIKFRIYPLLRIIPEFPTHIDIEPASQCQMRCAMCYTTYMDGSVKGVMKWDLFKSIIDQCAEKRVYSVRLSWRGESLLNKQLLKMLAYAKSKGFKEVAFLTNAELITEDVAEKLVDIGVTWISISADGTDEVYEEIRAPAKFSETVQKVAMIKSIRQKKNKSFPLLRVQSLQSAAAVNLNRFYAAWENVVDRINLISDEVRDFTKFEDSDYDHLYFCDRPWTRLTIAHDGRVHNCVADYSGSYILGDANHEKLEKIWHGQRANFARQAFVRNDYYKTLPPCRTCSRGLKMSDSIKIDVAGIKTESKRYMNIEPLVRSDGYVTVKVPEELLTAKIKKARGLRG